MPTLPFCKPAYHRIPWHGKLDRLARLCYFLNLGYNHGSDCIEIMDAEAGRIVHSRDVTWHQPREPLITPAPTVGSELPQLPSGSTTSDYMYIQPAPTAITTPTAAPEPAPDNAAPAHPRRHDTRPNQSVIALFGSWDMTATSACLVARGARRERCGSLRAAWV